MSAPSSPPPEQNSQTASARLASLVRLGGTAEHFWSHYLQAVGQALSARRVLLLTSSVGRPWQARAQWPVRGGDQPGDVDWTLELVGEVRNGQPRVRRNGANQLALVMTPSADAAESGAQVLAVVALGIDADAWDETRLLVWAALAEWIPSQWSLNTAMSGHPPEREVSVVPSQSSDATVPEIASVKEPDQSAQDRAQTLHDVMRLAIRLQEEKRFMAMAMAMCNELALRFDCERVSLGWVDQHDLKLTAVSHVEHFDPKSQATRSLEAVMDEALAQESVLLYPAEPGTDPVLRAHQAYCEKVGATCMTTVPLLHAESVMAVLCLERQAGTLTAAQLWELQLIADAVARWQFTLHEQDRWFGARWWAALNRQASQVFKPSHIALKLTALTVSLLLALLSLLSWPYRVDAALAIRSQDLLFMPAPFDGYLRKVNVHVGEQVAEGAVLVELDTRDLALEASMAEADLLRHSRDSEKAMAAHQLAEMQIAAARAQQSASRLDMIRYQLEHAQVRAPYAGVVIEGDLKKNLGAPVRKGDLLLKLAQTSQAYIELEIDQAYIHEVKVGSRAEFALVGRPQDRYDITISRIDPAAVNRDGRTFYVARADVDGNFEPHWRPGMGGNAKIDVGLRSPLWIMTQRTVRFMREFFWL
ncbi:HlyD family efflux transporter periplasmic adaptor subunit [Limnohabitans sp. 2KL-3]|uniref:HlyD family efflux transporter periplasmic adaptor subunit n=1 Tax=Limnohabitans sp. 2KL-3 TaxID=1100700 RepID=UPI000A774A8A|nr:HlyD family efflux transporter periplasmic adaptor subunit [Limnohabitans sp. 2KL-3]